MDKKVLSRDTSHQLTDWLQSSFGLLCILWGNCFVLDYTGVRSLFFLEYIALWSVLKISTEDIVLMILAVWPSYASTILDSFKVGSIIFKFLEFLDLMALPWAVLSIEALVKIVD